VAGRNFERMQDYIVGRLSDDERRAFENRLVREPALVRELEESLQLREGLEQLRAKGYSVGLIARLRSARFWPALAAAAVAALALFLSWHREIAPPSVLTEPVSIGVAPLDSDVGFTFRVMRGEDKQLILELPPPGMFPLRIAPATQLAGSLYSVTLRRLDAAGSVSITDAWSALPLGPDGLVHCSVDASRLTAGSYSLHIEREGAETDAVDFPFSLKAAGSPPSQ
jgi:hypothetical protein